MSIPFQRIGEALECWLESYLVWLDSVNPRFAQTLTVEELCAFMLHRLDLPVWLQLCLRQKPFETMVKIHSFLAKQADRTALHCFAAQMEIYPPEEELRNLSTHPEPPASPKEADALRRWIDTYALKEPDELLHSDYVITQTLILKRKEEK